MRVPPCPRPFAPRLAVVVVGAALIVTGCAPRAQIESALPPLPENTPWPTLAPTSTLSTQETDTSADLLAEAEALMARAEALRRRASALSAD